MSTKYVVAAAALATIAISQTEAQRFTIDQHKRPAMPKTGPVKFYPRAELLDEEQADWEFDAGIKGGAGGKPEWHIGIGAKWDEEQQLLASKRRIVPPSLDSWKRLNGLLDDEEQADWQFDAGIKGGAGGKPEWHIGIGAKWDEEQQLQGPKMFTRPPAWPFNQPCTTKTCPEHFKKFLYDEEQTWKLPSPPSQKIPLCTRFPSMCKGFVWEEDEQQGFGSKLENTLDRIDKTIDTWERLKGLFDEEEEQQELKKIVGGCIRVRKTLQAAAEHKLLDEDQLQGFGSKLDKLLGRVDRTVGTIDRVKKLL